MLPVKAKMLARTTVHLSSNPLIPKQLSWRPFFSLSKPIVCLLGWEFRIHYNLKEAATLLELSEKVKCSAYFSGSVHKHTLYKMDFFHWDQMILPRFFILKNIFHNDLEREVNFFCPDWNWRLHIFVEKRDFGAMKISSLENRAVLPTKNLIKCLK